MTQDRTSGAVANDKAADLRKRLVQVALDWEQHFGVAPSITSVISEWDAAKLVGMEEKVYCEDGRLRTAVTEGFDFKVGNVRYQVTANRPSGKKGARVTLVSQKTEKKKPFGWDRLIWILYDRDYVLQEAWQFTAKEYQTRFKHLTRLSPDHMRQGHCLFRLTRDSH